MTELQDFFIDNGHKVASAKDGKFKVHFRGGDDESDEEEEDQYALAIKVKMYRVKDKSDEPKYCIEFTRIGGDTLTFYKSFDILKDTFKDLIA
jgi:hypothetical protein